MTADAVFFPLETANGGPTRTETAGSDTDEVEALNAAGIAAARDGRLADAILQFKKALDVEPAYPQSLHNLGVAQAETGRREEAIESFRAALRARRDYPEAHCGLGNTLSALARHAEAVYAYRAALALRPDYAGALNGLGLALVALKRPDEAVIPLRQAARLDANSAAAHGNLGLALAEQGNYAAAEAAFETALQLDPAHAEAHVNLANTLKEQGKLDEALAAYELALWIRPGSATARWNRSLAMLQAGRFEEGWREYEWRWQRGSRQRQFAQPRWDGSSLAGRTILVHMEQGLGDVIMFTRYLSLLKRQGAKVIAEYPAPLAHVLPTCPGPDQWLAEGSDLPAFDVHAPVMSLPHLLGTTLQTVPAEVPYLFAPAERVAHWRGKLSARPGFKVGVAWQGNPHHPWDRHRSVALERLAPLAAVGGVRLVSLQRGPGSEQLAALAGAWDVEQVLDPALPDAEAMAESAALIQALDLVITVDTATAHLAGASGVPVWVALSTMVDWRWMLHRPDTPWYPTMRLFRQDRRGEWDPVFARMADELRARAAPLPRPAA